MTATPAWPPQSTPRLYVEEPLAPGPREINGSAAHYLAGVMRMKAGDPVKLFDDVSGEWLGVATDVGRRSLTLDITEKLRDREPVPDLWLCAAPLKKGRVDWLAEKACELGVDRLVPVPGLTDPTLAEVAANLSSGLVENRVLDPALQQRLVETLRSREALREPEAAATAHAPAGRSPPDRKSVV